MNAHKLKIRVVDTALAVTATEVESLLNGLCDDGYYLRSLIHTGLPDGIGMRAVFSALKVKTDE